MIFNHLVHRLQPLLCIPYPFPEVSDYFGILPDVFNEFYCSRQRVLYRDEESDRFFCYPLPQGSPVCRNDGTSLAIASDKVYENVSGQFERRRMRSGEISLIVFTIFISGISAGYVKVLV